jgi:hypothetical protein
MKKHFIYIIALVAIVFAGCQKELSEEQGNVLAEGSLQAVTGDCLPQTINGAYIVGTALTSANTIQVTVNVTTTGRYEIFTDTVNGYFFRGSGIFTVAGANLVTLRSTGTPFAAGTNNFTVAFDSTFCNIAVDVLPAGSGPASFTLVSGGTPSNCASAVVSGTYVNGAALNASNYVDITVNVASAGTYTAITATGGGMTFTKTGGVFSTTGNQTIRLAGTGTPATTGANTVTFGAPFASCNFTVTVDAPAAYTINCAGVVVNGTYTAGSALTAANTITIPITVTTAGSYGITANINGMTFSNSGTLTTATTSITLNGSGAPTTATGSPFSLTVGSCTIPITVLPGAVVNWKFTVTNAPSTTYQGETDLATLANLPPLPGVTFAYTGSNVAGTDNLVIALNDISGTINNGETYSSSATLSNAAGFQYDLTPVGAGDIYRADPSQTGVTMTFTVQNHNTTTRTISGIFSGTAKNNAGQTITITAGEFSGIY